MNTFETTIWHCSRCGTVKFDPERKTCHQCGAEFGKEEDWEYSDSNCPKCQEMMAYRGCNECGGEGFLDEDEDDEWSDGGTCDNCNGKGFEEWCRECGWDNTYRRFMSPQYEQAFKNKQEGTNEKLRSK